MTQPSYPPPPAPTPSSLAQGFHGPRTNLFLSIRSHLSRLETPAQLREGSSPKLGLFVSLIIAGLAGIGLSIAVQLVLLPAVGMYAMMILVAPLTEEPFKAVGMLVVAYLMWKSVPNRRYGAALGAAAGLGFGVAESILYIYQIATTNLPAELIAIRIIVTPFMHPLWSAFVGLGIFALTAKRSSQPGTPNSPGWLPWFFLAVGMINHILWNGISVGLAGIGYGAILLNLIVIFPLFAFILRDFLGGHFNFSNFFERLAEPSTTYPFIPPPPPPPPP